MKMIATQHRAGRNFQPTLGSMQGELPFSPAAAYAMLFRKYHPPIIQAEAMRSRLRVEWQEPSALEGNG